MKIIHTSDWHLGQKLINRDRLMESQFVLSWLYQYILDHEIEGLIIAGDVFDNLNPPNAARNLYYKFLSSLVNTSCQHIVVVGGNHDSATMLDAPAEVLKAVNVYVIGGAREDITEEIVYWKDENEQIKGVCCAVPFLSDKDVRKSVAGESYKEREDNIRLGIKSHYQQLADILTKEELPNIPIIATGHLYAAGAHDDKESKIYIGNFENMAASEFPDLFDYIALGHIHRSQRIGGTNHIRYSGSLIPLSFSESNNQKGILQLDFEGKNLKEVIQVDVPVFRDLLRIKGSNEEVREKLINVKKSEKLTTWIEVEIISDHTYPNLMDSLQEYLQDKNAEICILKLRSERVNQEQDEPLDNLESIDTIDVFERLIETRGYDDSEKKLLKQTYTELLNWMEDTEYNR